MENKQKLVVLANKLQTQVEQARETFKQISDIARQQGDHELKWLVLTEIGKYLTDESLIKYTKKLENKTKEDQ